MKCRHFWWGPSVGFLVFLTAGICPLLVSPRAATASGAEVDARTEFFTQARGPVGGGGFGELVPLTLIGDAVGRNLGFDGLELQISVWGALQANGLGGGDRGEGDLSVAMLRYQSPRRLLDLRLGRQLLFDGMGRFRHLDAANAFLQLPFGFVLQGFGGFNVGRRVGSAPGWIAGGRVGNHALRWLGLDAAYTREDLDEGYARDRVGGTASIGLLPARTWLSGSFQYDLTEKDLVEGGGTLRTAIRPGLDLDAAYRKTRPALLLPSSSLLAVFGDGEIDEISSDLRWRFAAGDRWITVGAGGGAQRVAGDWYGQARLNGLLQLGPRASGAGALRGAGWLPPASSWLMLELIRSDAPAGGYVYTRAAMNYRLRDRLGLGGDLQGTFLDESKNGGSKVSGGGSVYAQWVLLPDQGFSLLAKLAVATRPGIDVAEGLSALLRLLWTPQVGGAAARSAGPEGDAKIVDAQDRLKMDHFAHAKEDVDCGECHAGVRKAGAGADLLPQVGVCDDCHDLDHRKISKQLDDPALRAKVDLEECGTCHTNPLAAGSGSLPRPDRGLSFSHARHLGTEGANCLSCHGGATTSRAASDNLVPPMEGCRSCHDKELASMDCGSCHEDLSRRRLRPVASFSHGGNFLRAHGTEASARPGLCAGCHDQPFCATCHADTQAFPLSFRQPERSDRALIHPSGYLARHEIDASRDPTLCMRCHGVATCQDCHQRGGIAGRSGRVPHPQGFMAESSPNFHGRAVRSALVECAGCHDRGRETNCIQCHAVGGVAAINSPHPAGWATADRQIRKLAEKPCTYCHSRN